MPAGSRRAACASGRDARSWRATVHAASALDIGSGIAGIAFGIVVAPGPPSAVRNRPRAPSQLDSKDWHPMIGEATVADSINDRLVHNAHRIKLSCESMRKSRKPQKS